MFRGHAKSANSGTVICFSALPSVKKEENEFEIFSNAL